MAERVWRAEQPKYDKDPAFILRMMEVNELRPGYFDELAGTTYVEIVSHANERQRGEIPVGRGKDIPDAVLNWIVAADKAGIEVKR